MSLRAAPGEPDRIPVPCRTNSSRWTAEGPNKKRNARVAAHLCRTECPWFGNVCTSITAMAKAELSADGNLYGVWDGRIYLLGIRGGPTAESRELNGCNEASAPATDTQ